MKFTVEDALKLDTLKKSKVIGGHKGLQNPIRFVNVMEVPDISDWISGYEMILTTAYPYKDSENSWDKLIKDLEMKKLSAFAIKVDRYISRIPDEIIEMGNKLNIPIIELSADAKFDLIINDVMREVVNKDYSMIKKSQKIHKTFTDIILSGGELKEIVNTLYSITNHHAIIEDLNQNIVVANSNYKFIGKDKKEIKKEIKKEEKRSIIIDDKIVLYLKLISLDKKEFDEIDIIALERARDAVAMVSIKTKGKEEIEKKYKNVFLIDFIKGEFKSKEELLERAKFYNLDLNNSFLLFILDVNLKKYISSKESQKKKRINTYNLLTDLFNVVFNSFFTESEKSVVWSSNTRIYVLYPIEKEFINNKSFVKNKSIDLAKDIKARVNQHIKEFNIDIGIGRFYKDVMDLDKSFDEAKKALKIGKLIWNNKHIFHYDDIETYNILMRSGTKEELLAYVEDKLGKLIEYDDKKNTELVDTLNEILNNDGNLKITSEKLFLHSKTISYRRDQIEDILGISLNNIEDKLSIYMALKIRDLL